MDIKISQEKAIKNAISSVSMEGLRVTVEMVELCKHVLNGERSTKECLELLEKNRKRGEINAV